MSMLLLNRRGAFAAGFAALLAACGMPAGPGATSAVIPHAAAPAARSSDLLYVSDTETSDVYVFSYPKGALVQTLTGFVDPAGECVDKSGDVFIANTGGSNVLEYAHGGTSAIATLKDPGYFPVGCSIDPTTGNLAVTNFSTTSSTHGDLVIYKQAKGRARGHYTDPTMNEMVLCGYDDAGNLFVDGLNQSSAFEFDELGQGSTKLTNIALNQSIESAGGVEWDGKYVTVGDQATDTIYQFSVSGKKGTEVGSTTLGGAVQVFQYWIEGSKVIGPDAGASDVGIWPYPRGGSPVKTISGLYAPLGATVSKGT
jgi:DNA-binding beta-propeller fold protein YncE